MAAIFAAFLIQAFVLFKPENTEHNRFRVRVGAILQGLVVGGLVGLVLLPLRLSFPVPGIPGPGIPGPEIPGPEIPGPEIPGPEIPGPAAVASTAVLPAFLLILVVRQGLLARVPVVGRDVRPHRQAALKYGIDLARTPPARLQRMETKQRAEAPTDA